MQFDEEYLRFWQEFGKSRKMVLSTSLDNLVTSRMMSVLALDGKLYFQTDRTFRKYDQLIGNPQVALCIDNIQIEGRCEELGYPLDYPEFTAAYEAYFSHSFRMYSALKNERLFAVTPTFIEKWLYIEGLPYMETFDVKNKNYALMKYQVDKY